MNDSGVTPDELVTVVVADDQSALREGPVLLRPPASLPSIPGPSRRELAFRPAEPPMGIAGRVRDGQAELEQ
jgi:hypothetical protein